MRAAREDMPRKRLKRPGPCDACRARRPGSVRQTRAGDRRRQVERSTAFGRDGGLVGRGGGRGRCFVPVMSDAAAGVRRPRAPPAGRPRGAIAIRPASSTRRESASVELAQQEGDASGPDGQPAGTRSDVTSRTSLAWMWGADRAERSLVQGGPARQLLRGAPGSHPGHRHPVVGSENPRRTSRLPKQHSPRCSSLR